MESKDTAPDSLDDRIALEVMGAKKVRGIFTYWSISPHWEAYEPSRHQGRFNLPEEELTLVYEMSDDRILEYPPRYASDMAEAMNVVDRMSVDGFSFKAWQPSLIPDVPRETTVSFICGNGPCEKHGNPHHNHHGAYEVGASTLPLAICKAALIALGKLPVQEQV